MKNGAKDRSNSRKNEIKFGNPGGVAGRSDWWISTSGALNIYSLYFHELGHNYFSGYYSYDINEALAEIACAYLLEPGVLDLSKVHPLINDYFSDCYSCKIEDLGSVINQISLDVLKKYEQSGSTYESYSDKAGVAIGVLLTVAKTYGWKALSKLNDYTLMPPTNDQYSNPPKDWTVITYRLSLGAGTDLTKLFRDRWRLPL